MRERCKIAIWRSHPGLSAQGPVKPRAPSSYIAQHLPTPPVHANASGAGDMVWKPAFDEDPQLVVGEKQACLLKQSLSTT